MLLVMQAEASESNIQRLRSELLDHGLESYRCDFGGRASLAVPGADEETLATVSARYPVQLTEYPSGVPPLTSRAAAAGKPTAVPVGDVVFDPGTFVVAAGPCAVENPAQLDTTADLVALGGAAIMRGGAFKPRTSPYSFQGLGAPGLELLAAASRRTGMPVVTEVLEPGHVDLVAAHADMLQIGTRNAQNYALIREAGRTGLPVLLKRGFSCTVDEWLHAAEYVLREGNPRVVLCERGIRTFEARSRFTLDLTAVAIAKRLSHLPVVVDPSHATGSPDLVVPMTLAAAAAGADGVLLDVHPNAAAALCDGPQALSGPGFDDLMRRLHALLPALGVRLAKRPQAYARSEHRPARLPRPRDLSVLSA